MSYFGSKFPEGINPQDYTELNSVDDISCPVFRRVVLSSLSSVDTTYFNCPGCKTKDALVIYLNIETERLFVRRDSPCTRQSSPT